MNIRLYITAFMTVLTSCLCYQQDPEFSNFASNIIYVNPAYAGSVANHELSLTYRNQWPGLPGSFVNYGAAAAIPVRRFNSGIGFYILSDIQGGGIIAVTSLNSIYAYRIKINSDINLNAGLQASYFFEKLDVGEVVFESDIRNNQATNYAAEIFESTRNSFWDFSLGFMAEINKFINIGFSVGHLTKPYRYFSSSGNSRLPWKYSFHASCELPLSVGYRGNTPVIIPSLLFQKYRQHNRISCGAGLLAKPLFAGIWTENNLNFNFSSLTVAAGYLGKNYSIIYNYDINLTGTNVMDIDMGAHEAVFLLKFGNKEKRRNNRAIKSSKL
jgi:type IX secretion system PorP/SprF family membrane protein